jgi:hypothetical protein
MRRAATALLVLALLGGTAVAFRPEAGGAAPAPDPVFDDAANFLAGRTCRSQALKDLQETAEYKDYVAALDTSWADLEAKRLLPMRNWAAAEFAESESETETLFYPFGGPDFLTAFVLFPNASTYVLQGLEFVGTIPSFEGAGAADRVKAYTRNLFASLSDFFNKSYFITKNMNAALAGDKVDGVLPIIVFFLKRTDHVVAAIRRCYLLENGEVLESPFPGERRRLRRPYGIKVEFFAEGTNRLRTLYYFSADLVDSVFRPDTAFHRYVAALPFETAFVKSAQYLMHYREFGNIRTALLAKSRFILQDDTGIPFRYFVAKDWEVQLYGEYIKPVSDFSGVEQADLKAAYTDPARVRPLPFHLGYHWGTSKDAILFVRRKTHERP